MVRAAGIHRGDPRSRRRSETPELSASSSSIAEAARERLLLWDISAADLADIAHTGQPLQAVPIRSPISGVVIEKSIVQGSAFSASQVLFRVARLDPVWVIASVPQQDAALVRTGMGATIRDPYGSSSSTAGLVSFVYPSLDSVTRSLQVRSAPTAATAWNRAPRDVQLTTPLLRRLAIPESAVLPTGERAVVFVDLGDGRLMPREVALGARAGGYYEVRSGLRAGEVVVTSGNFLVDAESKLRSAGQQQ